MHQKKIDAVSNLKIDTNKLIQTFEQEQQDNYDDRSSSSSDAGSHYWQMPVFATFMATTWAAAKQQAHADKEEEQPVDAAVLLDKKSLDALVYPELAKFMQRYSCSIDLETRANFVMSGSDYFQRLERDTINSPDRKKYDSYETAKNNPIYQKAGFFSKSITGKGGFKPTSGDIFKGSTSSEFFIKGSEIDRIINAQRMIKYLKDHALNNFKVVSECLTYSGKDISVISNKIDIGNQDKELSLQDVKQLVKIGQETGYWDWQFGRNLIRDSQGKFIFVDTEDISYGPNLDSLPDILSLEEKKLSAYNKAQRVMILASYLNIMDEQAQQWIIEKLDSYDRPDVDPAVDTQEVAMKKMMDFFKKLAEKEGLLTPLSDDTQYDAAIGIDFEQVKREFKLFQDAQIVEVD